MHLSIRPPEGLASMSGYPSRTECYSSQHYYHQEVRRNWHSSLDMLSGTVKSMALAFRPDHVAGNRNAYGRAQTRESLVQEQLADLTMLSGAMNKVRPEIASSVCKDAGCYGNYTKGERAAFEAIENGCRKRSAIETGTISPTINAYVELRP
jgi:hypothetical protein